MLIVMVLMCFLVYKPRSFVFFGFLCGQIGFQIVIWTYTLLSFKYFINFYDY